MTEWIKVSREEMDWVVKKGYEQFIPDKIWDKAQLPEFFTECQVVKNNILRASILISFPEDGGQNFFLKRNHRRHWKDDAKSLFLPSRSFSEWKKLIRLQGLNLPVPTPLAYGERRNHGILKDSCLIVEVIASAQSLNFCFSHKFASPANDKTFREKTALINQLARLIARLHHNGVYYRDLHGGNILCQDHSNEPAHLFFVDTEKARFFSRLSNRKRINDLAMLYNSLFMEANPAWSKFLKTYLNEKKDVAIHWKIFFRKIQKVARKLQERHIKSRSKRCLKKSTSFGIRAGEGKKIYFRKEFSDNLVTQALAATKRLQNEAIKAEPLRKGGKRKAFRIRIPDNQRYSSLWIREYRHSRIEQLKSVIGFSPGKKDWFQSNSLLVRKIPAPLPLALVEKKGTIGITASLLITEDLSFCHRLDHYIVNNIQPEKGTMTFSRKLRFIQDLAESFNRLYEKQIVPKTVRAENIFIDEPEENSWRCYLADLNRIAFNHTVSADNKLTNLLCFNESLPFEVGPRDRLRFLFHFLSAWPRNERKAFVRKVLNSNQLIGNDKAN